jgi:hemoglobin-like flavoprotein
MRSSSSFGPARDKRAGGATSRIFIIQSAHYDTVASALLWTLGQGLGNAFTPLVEAAWTEAYTILATVMKDAAVA